MRSSKATRRRGRRLARHPLTRVVAFRPARRILPIALRCIGVLVALLMVVVLAPLAHAQEVDSVTVSWTAAGDDGRQGSATAYDLRISQSPITADNFDSALLVPGLPTPATSGTRQRVVVRGLTHGTTYYFAIRSVDDAGNWSALSNVVRWDWIVDTAPPGAPQGLAVELAGHDARVTWSANSEPDLEGYRVYRALSAEGPFTALNASPLESDEYLDTAIPDGTATVWYRATALDITGNESAQSAIVSLVLIAGSHDDKVTFEPPYPNPSRGDDPVSIPVVAPTGFSGPAIVDVVNAAGTRVRRLEVTIASGRHDVVWDGRNDAGRKVVPGAYRAWLIAGETRTSVRLLRVP